MSETIDTDVLIVGAGPTGMVMALCLARMGVRSVLVDARSAAGRHPKAHELSPRSLEILLGLGIPFETLDAEASTYDDSAKVVFCGRLGEELGRIDLGENGADRKYFDAVDAPKPFLNLSQTVLERILEDRVRTTPEITLRLGCRWQTMTRSTRGIRSSLDGGAPARVEVHSRYVVAADGAKSRVRRALGIAMQGPDAIQDFVSAYFEYDLTPSLATRAKLYFALDPGCPGTFVAHHVEKRWVYHMPFYPPTERIEDFDENEIAKRIRHASSHPLPDLCILSIETWRMTAQVAERFRDGDVFLAGDAAHRFAPTGGLGMNSGIADAHNLAFKLALVLRGDADDTLLESYEAERRPVIARNCERSAANYRRIFDVIAHLGLSSAMLEQAMRAQAWLRRRLPRALVRALFVLFALPIRLRIRRARAKTRLRRSMHASIEAQRAHFDRIGLDLGATYARGALAHDGAPHEDLADDQTYVPSTAAGARFPFFLFGRTKRRSSHALLSHDAFTLFLGPDAPRLWEAIPTRIRARGLVRVIRLGEDIDAEPEALLSGFGLAHTGALLVRPDGYVAWRAVSLTSDGPGRLRAALRALALVTESAHERGARPVHDAVAQ